MSRFREAGSRGAPLPAGSATTLPPKAGRGPSPAARAIVPSPRSAGGGLGRGVLAALAALAMTLPAAAEPLGLGRPALPEEVAAWDIDVRPDGAGLPPGSGSALEGEEIYSERCAYCHGDFGEGIDRWPVLAGGQGTLTADRPVKTIGSYWPFASTVWDYVHRAMPFGEAQSLTDDEVYAVTAYILYLNDIVDEDFELSDGNFLEVTMPNEGGFTPDAREAERPADEVPCMSKCKPGPVEVTMRARVLDVTPDEEPDGGVGDSQ